MRGTSYPSGRKMGECTRWRTGRTVWTTRSRGARARTRTHRPGVHGKTTEHVAVDAGVSSPPRLCSRRFFRKSCVRTTPSRPSAAPSAHSRCKVSPSQTRCRSWTAARPGRTRIQHLGAGEQHTVGADGVWEVQRITAQLDKTARDARNVEHGRRGACAQRRGLRTAREQLCDILEISHARLQALGRLTFRARAAIVRAFSTNSRKRGHHEL